MSKCHWAFSRHRVSLTPQFFDILVHKKLLQNITSKYVDSRVCQVTLTDFSTSREFSAVVLNIPFRFHCVKSDHPNLPLKGIWQRTTTNLVNGRDFQVSLSVFSKLCDLDAVILHFPIHVPREFSRSDNVPRGLRCRSRGFLWPQNILQGP